MKKIISSLLFLAGIQGFSNTCNFANNPDIFLDRVIKKIQTEKRSNDIFCDSDNVKMAYYTIEDENYNANIGITIKATPTTTNDEFKKEFYKKFDEYKNFFTKIDTKNLGKIDFSNLKLVITPANGSTPEAAVKYGLFIQNVVNFFIMAFVIFLMVKFVNKLRKPATTEKPAEPEPTKEEVLLSEIRDILKNK